VAGEWDVQADIFRKSENVTMEGDEPGVLPMTALHVHHAIGHAGNVERCDVEDVHTVR
jgi:hypothetical protein